MGWLSHTRKGVCLFVCVGVCVWGCGQSYLHEPVSRPEVCVFSRGTRVHRVHKLPTLFLVSVQVEAVAVLAFQQVTQAGNKLVQRLRLRLQLQLRAEKQPQQQSLQSKLQKEEKW